MCISMIGRKSSLVGEIILCFGQKARICNLSYRDPLSSPKWADGPAMALTDTQKS